MSLHDLLDELAAGAPTQGAPAAELWQRGRRAARVRRLGTVAIIATACLGLMVVGTVSWHGRTLATPASTSGRTPAMPDRLYRPSAWLPSFDGAPGTLAAIMPACQNTLLGSRPGFVGVSATTGRYGFLKLPNATYVGWPALAPDGHAVAYWTEDSPPKAQPHGTGKDQVQMLPARLSCFGLIRVNGFAVYDLRTGHTTVTRLSSPHGIAPTDLEWADDHIVYATYGHTLRGTNDSYGSWASVRGVPEPSPAVLSDLSHLVSPAGHGRVLGNAFNKLAPNQAAHVLTDIATGARQSFTSKAASTGDFATSPGVVLSPDGKLSLYNERDPYGNESGLGIARLDPSPTASGDVAARPGSDFWPVGWIDQDHVAVISMPSGTHVGTHLQVVDVTDQGSAGVTGVARIVAKLDPVDRMQGDWLAYELLARPTFHAAQPPSPLGPRKELGAGAAFLLLAAGAIILWRRRARL